MPLLSTRGAGAIRGFGFAGASGPLNLAIPVISGTTTVGNALSATTGTWSGTPPITFTYQWKRAGVNISAATSSSYTLVSADAGNAITCTVTATNSVAAVSATSSATAAIGQAPVAQAVPTISGSLIQGATLTSSTPAFTGFPASYTYNYTWTRWTTGNAFVASIASSSSNTYTLTPGDVGYLISVTVTATNSVGSGGADSARTTAIQPAAGQVEYTSGGTYSWVAPAGVTSASVVVVGAGGGAKAGSYYQQAGGGGGLSWKNNIAVTPGASYSITVAGTAPAGNSGGSSSALGVTANGGTAGGQGSGGGSWSGGDGGGNGGNGGNYGGPNGYNSGGGAGGYSGNGGNGGSGGSGTQQHTSAATGSGGGGGGGLQGGNVTSGGGGGVGIYGRGADGLVGYFGDPGVPNTGGYGGGGGSGGNPGGAPGGDAGGPGGLYGGGGGGAYLGSSGSGASGAVRIIWGAGRAFPATLTANQ